eukprot:Gb_19927 [translate_table: standard]
MDKPSSFVLVIEWVIAKSHGTIIDVFRVTKNGWILQHSGVYPDYDQESAQLASGRLNVQNVTLFMDEWWGSGIVHAKAWISDRKDIYIGSANNDWKSLTQFFLIVPYLPHYITNNIHPGYDFSLVEEQRIKLVQLNAMEGLIIEPFPL